MSIYGYKAMNPDMSCRGFKYAIGKTYRIDGQPVLCGRGFHFCENAADVWAYYYRSDAIVCEVEALGEVVSDGTKSCTNVLRVVRRMEPVAEGRLRYDCGYGDGDGYGYGGGCGYGDGYSYDYSYGDGCGYGYGYGDGCDYDYGYGNGDGRGYGKNINMSLIWED